MSSILSFFLSYLLLYKYFTLFVLTFAAGVIVPIPISALTMAIGAFSGQGYFNFFASLLTAVSGNVLGDLFDYLLTRKYGYKVVHKFKINQSRFFNQAERYLKQNAGLTIFVTRFAGSLDPVVNFLSGLSGISFIKFLFYDMLGNTADTFIILYAGYFAGNYWQNFSGLIDIIGGIIIVIVLIFALVKIYRRISRS